jgi:hypothetical protein
MSQRNFLRIPALAGLVFLAACGDSPGDPGSGLSDQELVTLMMTASASAQGPGTAPCPLGGEVTSVGSSESSSSGDITTLTFDVAVAYDDCGHQLEDRIITLDGQTSITGLIRVQHPASGPASLLEAEYQYEGTLRWQGEDVDITCGIDIAISFEPGPNRYTVDGRVCGRDISQTVDL